MSLEMGPVLGFRGQHGGNWHVCALVVTKGDEGGAAPALEWAAADEAGESVGGGRVEGGKPLKKLGDRSVWRFAWPVKQGAGEHRVSYEVAGASGQFVVPASRKDRDHTLRVAYASCNGFSNPKDIKGVREPYALWGVLRSQHTEGVFWEGMGEKVRPYHVLVLGGDQLYADDIWGLRTLRDWNDIPDEFKGREPGNEISEAQLREEVGRFYFDLYCRQWSREGIREVLASIPTLMMWDDHDIFDGWGSYSETQQNWKVFKIIYEAAREHFCLFQLQAADGELEAARKDPERDGSRGRFGGDSHELPALLPGQPAFTYAYRVDDAVIVAADMRSERTREQVMTDRSREALFTWLDGLEPELCENFVLLSAIPLVYVNLDSLEGLSNWVLPDDPNSRASLSDDFGDQWRSRGHRVERLRLINRLLAFADQKGCRVTLVSGDVHVGGMGRIEARAAGAPHRDAWTINQLISSPIVNKPAGLVAYLLERLVEDGGEEIERGSRDITAMMVRLPTSGRYLINERNWLSLTFDYKRRVWAEWFIEDSKSAKPGRPYTTLSQVIHPLDFFNKG